MTNGSSPVTARSQNLAVRYVRTTIRDILMRYSRDIKVKPKSQLSADDMGSILLHIFIYYSLLNLQLGGHHIRPLPRGDDEKIYITLIAISGKQNNINIPNERNHRRFQYFWCGRWRSLS